MENIWEWIWNRVDIHLINQRLVGTAEAEHIVCRFQNTIFNCCKHELPGTDAASIYMNKI